MTPTEVVEPQSGDWQITTNRMSWGEWRASAYRLGSLDRCVDGPYRATEAEAIQSLLVLLAV